MSPGPDSTNSVRGPIWRSALLACLLLLLPTAYVQAGADEQAVAWSVPAGADIAAIEASVAQAAQLILDDDTLDIAALSMAQRSQLQLVSNRHAQAVASIEATIASLVEQGEVSRAQRWMPYLLLAEARHEGADRLPQAYAEAFRARLSTMDDLAALRTHYWFVANVDAATRNFEDAAAAHAGLATIPRAAALDLVRQAAFIQTLRAATLFAPALIEQDEERRFVINDEVQIPAGDGIVLSAHVARSRRAPSPQPAAMLFTIYPYPAQNRGQALMAAAHGYAGVVVDARGKRLGTGEIAPYEHEGEDANAAIDWISRQAWNDGRVAMYGGSYSGFAAWAAARHRHPALKAIAPYVAAIPGLGVPMENNVFRTVNYAWPFYVANNRLLDNDTYNQRERWADLAENWYASGRAYRDIDKVDGTPNPWLQRWLSHPDYDAYWQSMVPHGDEFADITIPVLSITGYYDDGQISALHYFKEHYRHLPAADHTLLIGPYDHFGAQSPIKAMQLRDYTLDPSAQFDTPELTFQWLDHVLRGKERPALLAGRVNYQIMGADAWGHAPSLDAAAGGTLTLHLSGAQAGVHHRLDTKAPNPASHLRQTVDFADRTSERHGYYPSLIVRERLDADSALMFVSAPFERAVDVVGTFSGELEVRINKRDFDFNVVLYELMQDGRVMQLSYYVGRASHAHDMAARQLLTPGEWTRLPFERTSMTGRRLQPGSRLLVTLDVLKDAQHQVNHGTGQDVSDETVADAGEPLQVDWRSDSVIRIPLQASEASPQVSE